MITNSFTLQPNYTAIYGSKCCRGPVEKLRDVLVCEDVGSTSYFYDKCLPCGNACRVTLIKLWDSRGTEVMVGDVIECLKESETSAEKYHAVYIEHDELTIRDLGNNNVGMWGLNGPIKTLGPYWLNLDKLDEEDLRYYWGTTMAQAQRKLSVYKSSNT